MSALTPDEEAELAALSRALFARNAQPDARARERCTELHDTSERYRLILRDEQMTLWRNPPTDRENY